MERIATISLRILLVVTLATVAIVLCLAARAHADTTAAEPALPEVSWIVAEWRAGHILQAIIAVLFGALLLARKRFPWLSTGNRTVYVAAALAGLGVFVEAAQRGTTPTSQLVTSALIAAGLIVMKAPTQQPTTPEPPK